MFSIKPYNSSHTQDWELVVKNSINGTFLHARSFMEYHGSRLFDASLLVYKKGEPVGIFPANRVKDEIHSHQGLSYGGLILTSSLSIGNMLAIFREILKYYTSIEIKAIHIKEVPSFYAKSSLEWMSYCMYYLGAKLENMELSFAIPLPSSSINYSKGRKWGLNKAIKNRLIIKEVKDYRPFWEKVLCPNLWEKHGKKPLHTLEEIQSLALRNAPNIRQFNILENSVLIGGTTIFETETTAHTQYIAATRKGKSLSALDLLMDHLIQNVFSHKAYFDFGTVNERQGNSLNQGLMKWKESFGARPFVHRFYRFDLGKLVIGYWLLGILSL